MAVDEKAAYRWPMLAYLFLINLIVNGFVVHVLPPLFPRIAVEMNLNYAQLGSIWGALALGMLFFSLIGGVAADRFGVKRVISVALICAAALGGLRGLATDFWTLWLCMLFMGVSYGFVIPNLTKGVAMWFGPTELGRANGLLLMGPAIGAGLGLLVGAPLATALGSWQNVMFLGAGLSVALWVLWLTAARERQPIGAMAELMKARPGVWQGLRRVFSVKEMWLLCFIELFIIGRMASLMGLLPTFLVEKGMSDTEAGVFVSLANWSSLAAMLVGPWLSDRIGLRRVFVWPFLLVNVVLVGLIPVLWGWPLYLVWILSGVVAGMVLPLLRSIIMELKEIGPTLAGSAFGGIFTFNRIGGFAVPWLMGLVMTASAAIGVYFVAGLGVIPAAMVLFVRETGGAARRAAEATPRS
jgi:NNP family nitrate/nitrite transporter-like MFS transporter